MKSKHLAFALIKLSEENSKEEAVVKFLNFIKKANLTNILPQVIFHLGAEALKRKEMESVKITSSHKLSSETINKIKKMAKAPKDAPEIIQIDRDVIGGFVASYNGVTYDASLKGGLNMLRRILKNNN